tara:strand:- start:346 stop:750 length:405 start_codon:yes stop_codon:yes gene_type:complete
MEKKKVVLKFKEETTPNGNVVKNASFAGTLLRMSEKVFDYTNADGVVINFKLADVRFTDAVGTSHVEPNVHVYEASFEQGMETGETYLGKVTRSKNADGTARSPWFNLYSVVVGVRSTDDDFEEYEVPAEELAV